MLEYIKNKEVKIKVYKLCVYFVVALICTTTLSFFLLPWTWRIPEEVVGIIDQQKIVVEEISKDISSGKVSKDEAVKAISEIAKGYSTLLEKMRGSND